MSAGNNLPFDARGTLTIKDEKITIYRLNALQEQGIANIDRLPFSIRILLENLLRHCGVGVVTETDINKLAGWRPESEEKHTIPFMPARVVLQDFTGVPVLVDLAAIRSAIALMGGDPTQINPMVPVDLVIDHSVQVDHFGTNRAYEFNVKREMERNSERYTMLRWGQKTFDNFRVVPPGTGIVHQVNLEYLASVVQCRKINDETVGFPDTLIGTDSHTTMINGLGVVGWGVGGIEAEAVLLGQPYFMVIPEVVGMKLSGRLPEGSTATDLALVITKLLRDKGVVGRFVEFFGPGLSALSLPDRATISNMSPEYGATVTFFPVDNETLRYLSETGRSSKQVRLVEYYTKEQNLFHTKNIPEPSYSVVYEVDLSRITTTLAGPRKPHESISLSNMKDLFLKQLPEMVTSGVKSEPDSFHSCGYWAEEGGSCNVVPSSCACPMEARSFCRCVENKLENEKVTLSDGSVVIAAITSCTNTSNPFVMIGAGLLARKAVERGLKAKSWIKTSMAPGSRVVTDYLKNAGLMPFLEALGFHVVGYGCTTCIGNSGPLPQLIADTIEKNQLITAAVLSGNRNYEARINPYVRANYLASPILVVAYAIAGSITIDFDNEPITRGPNGEPVYLKEIWPSHKEIHNIMVKLMKSEMFTHNYAHVFEGDKKWHSLSIPETVKYNWIAESTYIQEPPFFKDMPAEPHPVSNIKGACILAIFGDTLTTDHISPAGVIPEDSPAGQYLIEKRIEPQNFNTYGSRRGNHQVMMRGTFGNIRIRNKMVDREGGWTIHVPDNELMTIYDAAIRYKEEKIPLIIIGGKEYGAGSSRDWAAKGTILLGVKAVIAESFERIHRSNLVGMGLLPLQFESGTNAKTLGLTGREKIDIQGIEKGLVPGGQVTINCYQQDNRDSLSFKAIVRLDNQVELDYYRHGGILQKVLRQLLEEK